MQKSQETGKLRSGNLRRTKKKRMTKNELPRDLWKPIKFTDIHIMH